MQPHSDHPLLVSSPSKGRRV
uniref:Uncharacterized protein n=1 Tax=Arundo donax TaxID=35708 RepID=A0A0A9B610_ARUDO